MMDLNGNVLREFLSMSEASINMCGKVTSTIGNHIANKNWILYSNIELRH
jgi:hypothetical protein